MNFDLLTNNDYMIELMILETLLNSRQDENNDQYSFIFLKYVLSKKFYLIVYLKKLKKVISQGYNKFICRV